MRQGFRSEAAARSGQLAMYHVRAGATIVGFRAIEITPVSGFGLGQRQGAERALGPGAFCPYRRLRGLGLGQWQGAEPAFGSWRFGANERLTQRCLSCAGARPRQTPNALVSRDCFFVRDPVSGVLYLWVGRGVSPELEAMATSLAPALSRSREVRWACRRLWSGFGRCVDPQVRAWGPVCQ